MVMEHHAPAAPSQTNPSELMICVAPCFCPTSKRSTLGFQTDVRRRGVQELAVMWDVLRRRDGAVALVRESLGRGIGKTSVYRAVQSVAEPVPGMKQRHRCEGDRTEAVGADVTSVRWKGTWLTLGSGVDAITGLTVWKPMSLNPWNGRCRRLHDGA